MYVRAKKNKRDFFFAVRHTRDIVIDLKIVKLIQSLSRDFSLEGERVFH